MGGRHVVEITSVDVGGKVAPAVQALAVSGDVNVGIMGKREVGEKQFVGMKAGNEIERGIPRFDGNVGRWSDGKNEGMTVDGDAGGIADKRDGVVRIEIADVVRSVARSVEDTELASTEPDGFAALEDLKVVNGDGQKYTELALHAVAIETGSTLKEFGRINHVVRAAGVHVNF